jgi:hypothetical protein
MIINSPEMETIAALAPRAVASYLSAHGWKRVGEFGVRGEIFGRTEGRAKVEVILPTSPTVRDFVPVMSVLLSELAKIENRAVRDVLSDLAFAPYDVIRVRSPEADGIGSISLDAGVELHKHSEDLIIASARAVAAPAPRAVWQGGYPDSVSAYKRAIRLGQSQRGSFIISLLSPWDFEPPAEQRQPTLFKQSPFGRQVTVMFAGALRATQAAIAAAVTHELKASFANVIASGVSANFCSSLAKLAQNGDGIDIGVNWSLTKPEAAPALIRLQREDAQILIDASRILVESAPIPDTTVCGAVMQINNNRKTFDGAVILYTSIDDAMRMVKVKFSKADRQKVFDAAKAKHEISVTGDLMANGRSLELLRPRDIQIIPSRDD